jgi:hypothetical protein
MVGERVSRLKMLLLNPETKNWLTLVSCRFKTLVLNILKPVTTPYRAEKTCVFTFSF